MKLSTLNLIMIACLALGSCTCTRKKRSGERIIYPNDLYIAIGNYNSIKDNGDDDLMDSILHGVPYEGDLLAQYVGYNDLFHSEFDSYRISWPMVDIRRKDGWNTWFQQMAHGSRYKWRYTTAKTVIFRTSGEFEFEGKEFAFSKNQCIDPPAYLHLVVDSVNDFGRREYSRVKRKRWVVDKILDLNGADVTNSPKWDCYSDNIYTFRKNLTVKYETGEKLCDVDQGLGDANLQDVYQAYYIDLPDYIDQSNPGDQFLILRIPDNDIITKEFTTKIISSSFNHAIFQIEHEDGELVNLHLVPRG